jgi:hypothetical protein
VGETPFRKKLDGITLHAWMHGKMGACTFLREQEQKATQQKIEKT